MPKYLLPCKCGNAIAIETSQAGQQIVCSCGAQLEVPTLGAIRGLQPAPTTAPTKPATEWNASQGMLFAGALILMAIGAAAAYFGYVGLRSTPDVSRETEAASFDKTIDEMSLNQVYDVWKAEREQGLGVRGQNVYVNLRNFRAGRPRILVTGIAFCIIGLLGAIGATLSSRWRTAA
jgi:hypothetical protein